MVWYNVVQYGKVQSGPPARSSGGGRRGPSAWSPSWRSAGPSSGISPSAAYRQTSNVTSHPLTSSPPPLFTSSPPLMTSSPPLLLTSTPHLLTSSPPNPHPRPGEYAGPGRAHLPELRLPAVRGRLPSILSSPPSCPPLHPVLLNPLMFPPVLSSPLILASPPILSSLTRRCCLPSCPVSLMFPPPGLRAPPPGGRGAHQCAGGEITQPYPLYPTLHNLTQPYPTIPDLTPHYQILPDLTRTYPTY